MPHIADCPRFCDAGGCWRPRRRVLRVTRKESFALDAEIGAQLLACERQGITPTHLDSHHHMHTEWGIAPTVIRAAKRHGIGAIRLALYRVRDGRAPRQRIACWPPPIGALTIPTCGSHGLAQTTTLAMQ